MNIPSSNPQFKENEKDLAHKFRMLDFSQWYTENDEAYKEFSANNKIAPPSFPVIMQKLQSNQSFLNFSSQIKSQKFKLEDAPDLIYFLEASKYFITHENIECLNFAQQMQEKNIFHSRYDGEFSHSLLPSINYEFDRSLLCYNSEKLEKVMSLINQLRKCDIDTLKRILVKGVALQLTSKFYFRYKKAVLMANLDHLFNFPCEDSTFNFIDINGTPGGTAEFLLWKKPNPHGAGISFIEKKTYKQKNFIDECKKKDFAMLNEKNKNTLEGLECYIASAKKKFPAGVDFIFSHMEEFPNDPNYIVVNNVNPLDPTYLIEYNRNKELLSHLILIFSTLKTEANCVLEFNETFSKLTCNIIFLLYFSFKQISFVSPFYSSLQNPFSTNSFSNNSFSFPNSYLVCQGFLGFDNHRCDLQRIVQSLKMLVKSMEMNKNSDEILDEILPWEKMPNELIEFMKKYNSNQLENQSKRLEHILGFIGKKTRSIHKITVVVSLMKYYGIPFEPPNTPLVTNPNEDIGYSRKIAKLHPGLDPKRYEEVKKQLHLKQIHKTSSTTSSSSQQPQKTSPLFEHPLGFDDVPLGDNKSVFPSIPVKKPAPKEQKSDVVSFLLNRKPIDPKKVKKSSGSKATVPPPKLPGNNMSNVNNKRNLEQQAIKGFDNDPKKRKVPVKKN